MEEGQELVTEVASHMGKVSAWWGSVARSSAICCDRRLVLVNPLDRIELLTCVRSLLTLKLRTDELERAESVLLALERRHGARQKIIYCTFDASDSVLLVGEYRNQDDI
jgi:hypothetical protein